MKIRRLFLILALLLLHAAMQAQTIGSRHNSFSDSAFFLVDYGNTNLYSLTSVDNNLFEFYRDRKGRFLASRNGDLVDTLKNEKHYVIDASKNFILHEGSLLILGSKGADTLSFFEFGLSTNRFSQKFMQPKFWSLDFVKGKFWGYFSDNRKQLYSLDYSSGRIDRAIDLTPLISPKSIIAELFPFTEKSKILIHTGQSNADGYDKSKFFVYNFIDNQATDVTEKLKELCWLENENNTWMQFDNYYSEFLNSTLSLYGSGCRKKHQPPLLIDENLNIVAEDVHITNFPVGRIYEQSNLTGIFVKSAIDNGNTVVLAIPEVPSLNMLDLLKQLRQDSKLSDNSLKGVSKNLLYVLKNFIYAKHNYKFKDLYWEAYSNQYEFYRTFYFENKLPRIDNVETLLTENDRSNLNIITKYIAKSK